MGRTMLLTSFVALLASAQAAEIPAQFQAWGTKADAKQLASVKIPTGYQRVAPPESNLTMPPVSGDVKAQGMLLFAPQPFEKLYPESAPFPEQVGAPLRAFATPGEYVSLQAGVRALDAPLALSATVTPPQSATDTIRAENIDLRTVRHLPWPKPGAKEYYYEPRFLESLAPGETVKVPANQTQPLWLTIKIPDNASPGKYNGKLLVSNDGKQGELPIQLLVLPFRLQAVDPYLDISFSVLSNDNDPRNCIYTKSLHMEHMPRHFRDMKEHGMNSAGYFHCNPAFSMVDGKLKVDFDKPGFGSLYSMARVMDELKKAGLSGPFIYQKGPKVWSCWAIKDNLGFDEFTPESDRAFVELALAVERDSAKRLWPELVLFVGDEPGCHADRLQRDKHNGELLKQGAPAVRVSNFFNWHSPGGEDWRYLAPVTDILCTHSISKQIIEEGAELGYKDFWAYANATSGRDLTKDRVAYGFHPWTLKLKGVTQFIYQGGVDNPYDRLSQEEHFFYAYPGPDGPLPAIHWEAVRQGTYDYQYLLTLNNLIRQAEQSTRPGAAERAKAARETMTRLLAPFAEVYKTTAAQHGTERLDGITNSTLNLNRWRLASEIMKLRELN